MVIFTVDSIYFIIFGDLLIFQRIYAILYKNQLSPRRFRRKRGYPLCRIADLPALG